MATNAAPPVEEKPGEIWVDIEPLWPGAPTRVRVDGKSKDQSRLGGTGDELTFEDTEAGRVAKF
jgi:hypothetical protein